MQSKNVFTSSSHLDFNGFWKVVAIASLFLFYFLFTSSAFAAGQKSEVTIRFEQKNRVEKLHQRQTATISVDTKVAISAAQRQEWVIPNVLVSADIVSFLPWGVSRYFPGHEALPFFFILGKSSGQKISGTGFFLFWVFGICFFVAMYIRRRCYLGVCLSFKQENQTQRTSTSPPNLFFFVFNFPRFHCSPGAVFFGKLRFGSIIKILRLASLVQDDIAIPPMHRLTNA